MRDLEQASNLLRMAEKDCRALRGLLKHVQNVLAHTVP
jgi:hypothetical protein